MAANLQMIGNAALLDHPDKVAFLSSRRISAADVLKCYEWAEKIRETETCVISGFQSPLEKDVLKFLLRGKVPIILVLARSLWKTVPEELRDPVGLGRLLIVSPVSATRASAATAIARNRWILANCTSLVLGSLDPVGSLARLVATFPVANMICLQGEARWTDPIDGVETMAMPLRDDMIERLKRPAKWSAEAFGEGGYEVVPPEKEEAFRKMAEEENRRRRPGMYAATQYYGRSVKGRRGALK